MSHPSLVPFRQPVNAAALKLKNYHQIITKPIDLGTIYSRCVLGEYQVLHKMVDDAKLMVANAKKFNPVGHFGLWTLVTKLISEGHPILIFSVWTSCLDLLGCLLEMLGLEYLLMDRSCPSDLQQERIDCFNCDASINVFLLSTKACGLGK